jgi:hypothetical protein
MAQTMRLASFGPLLVVSTLPVAFHPSKHSLFVLPQAGVGVAALLHDGSAVAVVVAVLVVV